MLKDLEKTRSSKVFAKVPEWSGAALRFPSNLSTEQCSSSATARFKAALVPQGLAVADLTGGLGVDLWAFAAAGASRLFYNDMNAELVDAVRSNYNLLSADCPALKNVVFSSRMITPSGVRDVLGGFEPDVIFLDPARRSESGRKVFRLQDCSPDLLQLKSELLGIAPKVIAKLSPMADIASLISDLGDCLSQVYVLGSGGECKEIVVVLCGTSSPTEPQIIVAECSDNVFTLSFTRDEEESSRAVFVRSAEDIEGKILFEPSAQLLKSGCFNLLCERYSMLKLGSSTHLYVTDVLNPALNNLGKCFRVDKVGDFSSSAIKSMARDRICAELSARGVPVRTDDLRARLRLAPADPSDPAGQRHLFVCGVSSVPGRDALLLDTRRIS